MAEYASKGLANGVGIPALVLGSLGFLGSANNGNGGLLGGIFGNGCGDKVSALMAENSMLKSENYSDKVSKETYAQTLTDNRRLRDEMFAYVKPIADEVASNRERVAVLEMQCSKNSELAELREKLVRAELGAKIDTVAQTCGCGINQLNTAVAGLSSTLNAITATIIPQSAICPPVMPRYNSFTTPTDTAPATQPVTGVVKAA